MHLLKDAEQLGEGDGIVAVWAEAAKTEATAEDVAVRAALFTEEAGLAGWALVDGVSDERLACAEIGRQGGEIDRRGVGLAQAIRALLAGIGAVAGAGRGEGGLADRARAAAPNVGGALVVGRGNRNASRNARGYRGGWSGSSGLREGLVGAHAVALAADVE